MKYGSKMDGKGHLFNSLCIQYSYLCVSFYTIYKLQPACTGFYIGAYRFVCRKKTGLLISSPEIFMLKIYNHAKLYVLLRKTWI